jgi:hypothetical protein
MATGRLSTPKRCLVISPNSHLAPIPTGLLALAQYDSNGDGWIDTQDPIWPALLVWIDANHNGISEPGELHSLASLGIKRISVKYKEVLKTDANGNVFRYKAQINDEGARFAYDVILEYQW